MTRRSFLARTALAAGGTAYLLKTNWRALAADGAQPDPVGDLSSLADSHDLRLPLWGSYTKTYNGISHVADLERGMRFDLSVFPGHYRREVMVPNVNWESGFHPWEAAPDLSFFSYRYELEWKDRVYCDVSFSTLSERARLVRAELVNHTQVNQNLVLHFMASINYPYVRPYTTEPAQKPTVKLPAGALWVNALDYAELQFATPRPNDSLVPDGQRRAEVRDHGFVSGGGIGAGFGKGAGDRVRFHVRLPQGPHGRALVAALPQHLEPAGRPRSQRAGDRRVGAASRQGFRPGDTGAGSRREGRPRSGVRRAQGRGVRVGRVCHRGSRRRRRGDVCAAAVQLGAHDPARAGRSQPPLEVCRRPPALRHRLVLRRVPGARDPQQRARPLLPALRP